MTESISDPTKNLINVKVVIFIILGILCVMVAWRVYQQVFAWDMGMDSFEPEFQTYKLKGSVPFNTKGSYSSVKGDATL
ncbi:MAG: hypothetical protein COB26_01050 [Piscirickettsiaceae bacterium]|nr:MAG: hypothetical protein COB26_01050 [Piscirickettsiaceae bacterium]